jgi:epoxyqueuosine reductase
VGGHQHTEDLLIHEKENLKASVRNLGIDLVGIASLDSLVGTLTGAPGPADFLQRYRSAIVLGAQLGKLGSKASSTDVNLFLEKAALNIVVYLEERGQFSLIVHTEDEFDPVNRLGLLSLKTLAKEAGLGWQGRSLLIVSPEYGPVHRWIAVLTTMDLPADTRIPNQCGECSLCVDKCPHHALRLVPFDDHPEYREEVLDVKACRGDEGCRVCLAVCPWLNQHMTA